MSVARVRSAAAPAGGGVIVAVLVTLGSVGVVACVGGSGSVPSQVLGGEEPSGQGTSGSGTATASGSDKTDDDTSPAPTETPGPTPAPSPAPSPKGNPGGCQEGSPCDCGSTKLVGTYTCSDAGKPTCSCKPVP